MVLAPTGQLQSLLSASPRILGAPIAEGWPGCTSLWKKEGLACWTSESSRRGPCCIEMVFSWKDWFSEVLGTLQFAPVSATDRHAMPCALSPERLC